MIAIANAGKHAVRAQNAQNIEVHLVFFRRACGNSRRLAYVVTGDLLPVFKEGGLQRSATEIRYIIISADDQPSDFFFVRADIGVDHEHGAQFVARCG